MVIILVDSTIGMVKHAEFPSKSDAGELSVQPLCSSIIKSHSINY